MIKKTENQNIEFKALWRDEFIKWICGFANANGGKLYIGVNNAGKIVGINNAKKLLEDIPNKVKDILGIVIDINLLKEDENICKKTDNSKQIKYKNRIKQKDKKEYLEIIVEHYPYPINYKGQYHYRTGSTKQELKGQALNTFLLKSHGKHWDGIEVPNIKTTDLDINTFEFFISKAIKSKRINENQIPKNFSELLDKLRLIENGFIKKAGVLLFAKDLQKYITGAYVKIAFFANSADILYQDVIEGNLFQQVEKIFDLLFTKYLKALISYDGLHRVEQFDYDANSLREIIHNAIVHKDYSSGIPIQIGVFKEKLFVYNAGQLPQNWTIETITSEHRSIPYNPNIANAFFKAGFIESWGRGIENVIKNSKKYNGIVPVFKWDNGLNVEFLSSYPNKHQAKKLKKNTIALSKNRQKIIDLIFLNPNITTSELSKKLAISTTAIGNNIKYLKKNSMIKRIGGAKDGKWKISNKKLDDRLGDKLSEKAGKKAKKKK